ncbi:MAG: ATP-binding protein [candidate division NC10 bacterium]|nr:ATP-binding protein [candidate division NC10 bacterium]
MQEFEKLGVFYLGRPYDLKAKKPKDGLLLYDSKDLVTHAVCIGMTGSGKTGLCLSLIEEALIDGIPALIIDPKGDLPNLLLTFPELRAEDFAPWVNEDDARKKGLTVKTYAEQQAALWKKGLGEWGQGGERIRRLRDAADFAVYTPGSTAGSQVSILKSFAAPAGPIMQDPDLLQERIGTTATSLLSLLGIEADPLRSREHILISKILEFTWKQGQDLDLTGLIQRIQTPPVTRIGALDLDAFYPAKERFALATALNNLLAAPGFDAWLQGEALDIDRMLHTPDGKPRASIFSIAHLSDAERMFFVSLLLNETLGWMRTQSGTTSLRAIVYMDEIFGYFPPVANPPSKLPLLTLLKQARAFGVGIVLATQNPVDLDYKGLANTGTWFIGRLQTERDKGRVLDGLEGAAAGTGMRFNRQQMEQILAGLGNRIFLLNNVHEDAPEIFETRWAMSYLRGPLTRSQIKVLMEPRKASAPPTERAPGVKKSTAAAPSPGVTAAPVGPAIPAKGGQRPVLPPDIQQYFLPVRGGRPDRSTLIYVPMLLGSSAVRFADAKAGVDVTQEGIFLAPITGEAIPVNWANATEANVAVTDLEKSPQEGAQYAELPGVAGKAKSYDGWSRDFAAWLYGSQKLELLKRPGSKERSRPGETERDFRIRLQESAHEERDRWAEQLRKKYAPKTAALEERLRRAQQVVEREKEQVTQQGLQTAISVGATLLGAFLGRKAVGATSVGRATTAARGVGRVLKERQDITRASDTEQALRQQLADLEAEFKSEMAALEAKTDPTTEPLESVAVKPKKADIAVRLVALVWVPQWHDPQGKTTPAWG